MRSLTCDEAMEDRFGKPDFTRSFLKNGIIYTPMGNRDDFWRIDSNIVELELARSAK